MKVRIHPMQQNYRVKMRDVVCGLCNRATPRTAAPPRVTHLVHLVRDHLGEVEHSVSAKGSKEDIFVSLEEV